MINLNSGEKNNIIFSTDIIAL